MQLELEELDLLFQECHLFACLRALGQHLLPEIYQGLLIVRDLSEDLGCRRLGVTDQLLREVSQARRVQVIGGRAAQVAELRHVKRRVV